jgi:hypothetical protein
MVAKIISLHMVICHYNEPVEKSLEFIERANNCLAVHNVNLSQVYIYDHGDKTNAFESLQIAQQYTNISNTGLEANCYATHLVMNGGYDVDSPDFVWFSHAVPDDYMAPKLWPRLSLLTPRTRMLCLSIIDSCNCDGCHFSGWKNFAEIYKNVVGLSCIAPWASCFNGEFIVAQNAIDAVDTNTYRYIFDLSQASDEHPIHRNVPDFRSSARRSIFAHIMERLWSPLFGCYNITVCECEHVKTPCKPDSCQCEGLT